jgi:6-pyruvoyl-tetrahydropterin synthase
MVVDFTHVKAVLKKYDHSFLGDPTIHGLPATMEKYWPFVEPSTAENFARILFEELADVVPNLNTAAYVVSVSVWETPSSKVTVKG